MSGFDVDTMDFGTDTLKASKEPRIPVMEMFGPTIQGEGLMSGTVTNFLRTGGCGLKCEWCDSWFAVDPGQVRKNRNMMYIWQILADINRMPWAPWLTLTGGDPCLHKHLGDIIPAVNGWGTCVAVETQGTEFPDWLAKVDVITFSPKPPSSGNPTDPMEIVNWIGSKRAHQRPRTFEVCIKIVVFTVEDLEYALNAYASFPEQFYDAFYFTAGTNTLNHDISITQLTEEERDSYTGGKLSSVIGNLRALGDQMVEKAKTVQFNRKVHVGCQLHSLMWPEIEQGV